MKVVSKLLYDNSPAEIFATVFFGVLHLDDGLLEFCSAGHTTGACICAEGGVRKLPANSHLMGAFAEHEFGLSTEHFEPNDLLFLYTDGLTEARRDGELFGEDRLFEMLAAERGGYPEHTLRAVVGKVLSFTEGRLSDDLAVLAVQRAAPSGG
jgi:serine phosphatase RsbU (regulator of sigma subunit)